jgi:DNA-directed RNA polymerase specialized sigma24 family protein
MLVQSQQLAHTDQFFFNLYRGAQMDDICLALLMWIVKTTYAKKARRLQCPIESNELIADCWVKQIPKIKECFDSTRGIPFEKYCAQMIHYFFYEYFRNIHIKNRLGNPATLYCKRYVRCSEYKDLDFIWRDEFQHLTKDLSSSEYIALQQHVFEERSINEIGKHLGISGAGASFHLCKAKKKLRAKMCV